MTKKYSPLPNDIGYNVLMQWKRRLSIALLSLGLISLGSYADAGESSQSTPSTPQRGFRIEFAGYQMFNKEYVFQIRLIDVPASQQPPLKKTGDPLGFGGFVIGSFHQVFNGERDPSTNGVVLVDESVLELYKPGSSLKIAIPFRHGVDLPK